MKNGRWRRISNNTAESFVNPCNFSVPVENSFDFNTIQKQPTMGFRDCRRILWIVAK